MIQNKLPISVSEFISKIQFVIEYNPEFEKILIKGEISNLRVSNSGHKYFNLIDEFSSVKCVLFRGNKDIDMPEDNLEVIIVGQVSIYKQRGDLQIIIKSVKKLGQGFFGEEFEKLFIKLESEGLFSDDRKRAIPKIPQRIGVVTSPSGSVIHDIITTLERRYNLAELIISPCNVQGFDAHLSVSNALEKITQYSPEVIILARGGGSTEDLSPFNNESLVRSIYGCKIPVISAIGHETDYTISDYVSDLRAPTPSSAAELVSISQQELLDDLLSTINQSLSMMNNQKDKYNNELNITFDRFTDLIPNINEKKLELIANSEKIFNNIKQITEINALKLENINNQLIQMSPNKIFERGFAALQDKTGKQITSISNIKIGDKVTTKILDGKFGSMVENINKKEK